MKGDVLNPNPFPRLKPLRLRKIIPPLIRNKPRPGPLIDKVAIEMRMPKHPGRNGPVPETLLVGKISCEAWD